MSESVAPRERTKTIEFHEPVEFAGQTYVSFDLRVPKSGELQKAQTHFKGTADSATRMINVLISLVTKMPEPAVGMVDMDITAEAGDWLMSFMPTPRSTSET